jgi:hypothetical protein
MESEGEEKKGKKKTSNVQRPTSNLELGKAETLLAVRLNVGC